MGDRANIVILDSEASAPLFLYTHWGGEELPATLARAIERGEDRWDDPAYFARIVFCDLIRGDVEALTDFGISTTFGDNEHPLLVACCHCQTVSAQPDSRHLDLWGWHHNKPTKPVPFAEATAERLAAIYKEADRGL